MPRYRTEIVVTPDRYVCLQLPAHFPEGSAVVAVFSGDAPQPGPAGPHPADVAHDEDAEWWEELDGESEPGD